MYGVKLAVYLSPADLYQLKTNPKNPAGYYGNDSSNLLSVIPTDPASFARPGSLAGGVFEVRLMRPATTTN